MAVCSSFDQWQKDVFFSAAEEVQESADKMESVYRMWVRVRLDGLQSEFSDELRRELQTSLGTAKWQLEEFERAVTSSHEKCSSEENTINRHKEFVAAIRNQTSHIEKAVNDSLLEEGKEPLQWIQLDEEERDDLEIFLSSSTLQETRDKFPAVKPVPESVRGFKETVTINKDAKYVVEVAAKEENINGQRRTWSSPDIGAWKIVIADEEDKEKQLVEARPEAHKHASSLCESLRSVDSKTKFVWLRSNFRKAKAGEHHQSGQGLTSYFDLKGITRFAQGLRGSIGRSRHCFSSCKDDSKVSKIQQIVGKVGGLQRQLQASQYNVQFGRSLRVTLLLVLTIFLIAPFVLYST